MSALDTPVCVWRMRCMRGQPLIQTLKWESASVHEKGSRKNSARSSLSHVAWHAADVMQANLVIDIKVPAPTYKVNADRKELDAEELQ
jgi:hypothetical protein